MSRVEAVCGDSKDRGFHKFSTSTGCIKKAQSATYFICKVRFFQRMTHVQNI